MKQDNQTRLYVNPTMPKDNFWQMLGPSILSIIACALCLVGLTMAWFSSSVETKSNSVDTTWFEDGQTTVMKAQPIPAQVPVEDGWYSLKSGDKYLVSVSGKFTEGRSPGSGYAKIFMKTDLQQKSLLGTTDTIVIENYIYKPINFYITATADCSLRVEYHWGTPSNPSIHQSGEFSYPSREAAAILNAQAMASGAEGDDSSKPAGQPEPSTYTVKSGDTLAGIAKEVGSTAEKLAAYNNIKEVNDIKAGTTLKIPPKDYEIPKPEDTSSKAPTSSEGTSSTSSTASTQPEPTSSAAGSSSDASSGTSSAN